MKSRTEQVAEPSSEGPCGFLSPEHVAPHPQVLDGIVDDESESALLSPASSSAGFSSSGTSNHCTSMSSHQASSISVPGSFPRNSTSSLVTSVPTSLG